MREVWGISRETLDGEKLVSGVSMSASGGREEGGRKRRRKRSCFFISPGAESMLLSRQIPLSVPVFYTQITRELARQSLWEGSGLGNISF